MSLGGRSPAFVVALALLLAQALTVACGADDPVAEVRRQQARGDLEASLDPLRELLAERPDDPELNFLYGRALALTGRPTLAQWSLRKAVEDPEWLVPAGLQLAHVALQTEGYSTAIDVTTRILATRPDHVDALLMRANAHAYGGPEPEQALADVERILAIDPDNVDAMKPRVIALIALKRYEEAGEAIAQLGERIEAAGLGPQVEAWHCATQAIFSAESGETERARELWADCTSRFPGNANVVTKAVEFYDAHGQYDRSEEVLRAALEAVPGSRSYRLSLAERLRAVGEVEAAGELLREPLETEGGGDPDPLATAAAWSDLSKHEFATGDTEGAVEAARRAVELGREAGALHPQLLLDYADKLLLAGDFEEALAVADEMTVKAHEEAIRARVAQERGNPTEALAHFEEVFRLWPDNPWARYYAARAAETLGDFERAIEAYRYSIRINPRATDARTRLGTLHAEERKPAVALQLLRTRAEQAPLDVDGELLSARLYAWMGYHGMVQQALAKAARRRPDLVGRVMAAAAEGLYEREGADPAVELLLETRGFEPAQAPYPEALRVLVRYAHEAGRLAEAESRVEAALGAHPERADLHAIRGLALELGERPEPARVAYERALELDPDTASALAGLGRLARRAGDPERALEHFSRAAEADPDHVEAGLAVAELLAATGRAEEAEARLEALLQRHPYSATAAADLAELRLLRGVADDRTLSLARRAVRFRGGEEAQQLLGRVQEQRDSGGAKQHS